MQRGEGTLVIELFDLLELDGAPLLDQPLSERREHLGALVDTRGGVVRLSEGFEDGAALLDATKREGLEGVIAKRASSPYRPGKRTQEWLKIKSHERQEFLIAGYTRGQGRRARSLGALVLAVRRGDELTWAGNCGTGFTDDELARLVTRLRPLRRTTSPLRPTPRMPRVRQDDVVWVAPTVVCEVAFAEWTRDGRLRAPSYLGLREDKVPHDVRRERPAERELGRGQRTLGLRNLDKVFWPQEGVTKGDLVDFYERIAPVLVPHLRDRPFTMKRFPDGIEGEHFFQKDAPRHMPAWIRTAEFAATSRDGKSRRMIRYPLVNDTLALLWMVNMGCIDLNTWLSRVDRPDRPGRGALRPRPVRRLRLRRRGKGGAAREGDSRRGRARRLSEDERRRRDPRRSCRSPGATPSRRRRAFASIVAETLARTHPGLVTTEWSRAKRRGVLIDANQNRQGATIASVYSVRPRPGVTVSTPLRWNELTADLDPATFTMEAVLDRVEQAGDLFAPVLELRQSLGRALRSV